MIPNMIDPRERRMKLMSRRKSTLPIYDNDDAELGYEDDSEGLSVYDAALIWLSNGKDEDYTFGYSEDELEDAL